MTAKKYAPVTLRVTAREGRYIPGVGSRKHGELLQVDARQAAFLLSVGGFERVDNKTAGDEKGGDA